MNAAVVTRIALPIDVVLPDFLAALRQQASVVLRAPTGAGKTTRVPPAILDAGLAEQGRILLLEPRRLAARAAARRMADERGGRLGDEIGYQVRFDRRCGPQTRILVVTPGILTRLLHDDPFLESTHAVLFDEFHERSLESDLALGMIRLVQQTVRPELRIVVMSATLAVESVSAYLGGCPIVASEGRLYPVEIVHEPRPERQPWPLAVAQAAERTLERTAGDLLVFLPGLYEIRQTSRHLEALAAERGLAVLPLHGDLPPEQQDAALLPQSRRKIVLATNVAETSVTVEGVTAVVDSGLARMLVFDPHVGLDRLQLTPISRASADQRAGRAGRTQPGICVRLWSASAQRGRPEQTEPEIRRVDLAGAVLQLLCLGEADVSHFPWLEPPKEAAVTQALALLRRLAAIDEHGVTERGRAMARLPVHPRLGRLLIEGQRFGRPERVALAAALLSERDPFTRSLDQPASAVGPRPVTSSDVLDRLEALEEHERTGRTSLALGTLNRASARFVLRARDQLLRKRVEGGGCRRVEGGGWRVEGETPSSSLHPSPSTLHPTTPSTLHPPPASDDEIVLRSLLAAFPDRVARRRDAGGRRGVMVGGRGVRLAPTSGVLATEFFLCIDVDASQKETLVRQASAIEREWLPAEQVTTSIDVEFDADAERVRAKRRVRFADLVIEETDAALPDTEATARALATAVAEHPQRVTPPDDSLAGLFRTRVRCLRTWMPDLQLPPLDDTELHELLFWLCHGCRSFADLRKADWLDALRNRLSHTQRQAVEREAPERLTVPSGSHLALRYELGRPPILAVRIQEVFGLTETPRIAGGRVPVLLHLLAPNYRPQQVTDDLASFWANTYPQVRKELRSRYPKHAWPEDPWTATPEKRPRRKRS